MGSTAVVCKCALYYMWLWSHKKCDFTWFVNIKKDRIMHIEKSEATIHCHWTFLYIYMHAYFCVCKQSPTAHPLLYRGAWHQRQRQRHRQRLQWPEETFSLKNSLFRQSGRALLASHGPRKETDIVSISCSDVWCWCLYYCSHMFVWT